MSAIKEKNTYNIAEFRANLSELLKRASAGEEIIVAKAGKPIVKLQAIEKPKYRELGKLAHMFSDEEIEEFIELIDGDYDYSDFYSDINIDLETD